jgi:type II secretory pathway pseudopilin PulG
MAGEQGVAMVALIVAMIIMGVMLSVALPAWQTMARREKEAELVFRGEQYARAIAAFQRKYANTFPPSVDVLVREKFLRKKYLDPITGEDFDLITPGTAIAGSTTPTALQAGAGGRVGATQGARGTTTSQGARGGGSAASSISTGFSLSTSGGLAATGGRGAQPSTAAGRATNSTASARGGFTTATVAFGGATTGVMGVRSKSKDKSLRTYNGAETYDQWLFMATQATLGVSAPGGGVAGAGGRGGRAPGPGQAPTTGGRGGMQPLQPSGIRGRGEGGATPPRGGATPPTRGGGGFGGGGTGGRGF